MNMNVTSKTSYMPQALADLDTNSKVTDTAGQQTAPAQGSATNTSSAAPSNSLRGLLPDARIAAQLKQPPAGSAQPGSVSGQSPASVAQMPHDEYVAKYNNAVQMLAYYGMFISGASDGGTGITRKDLEIAVNDKSLPEEARNACQFLLDSQTAFDTLETRDQKAKGLPEEKDGIIGWEDFAENPETKDAKTPGQYDEYLSKVSDAATQLLSNFSVVQGASGTNNGESKDGITADDLKAIANDEFADDDLRAACQFLLDSQISFNYFDNRTSRDGIIEKLDLYLGP